MTEAERKIAAIDARIDAIYAELHRVTPDLDDATATAELWQRAWNANGALFGFLNAAFLRRDQWVQVALADDARAAAEERREEARRWQAMPRACPTCGATRQAA